MTDTNEPHELSVVFTVLPDEWKKRHISVQRKIVEDRFFETAEAKGLVVRYDGFTVHKEGKTDGQRLFEEIDGIEIPEYLAIRATGWVIPKAGELDLP